MGTEALSQIHPAWRGHRIPSAFAALARGIKRDRIRFEGVRFLALCFRQEFDWDGLTEGLQLLEGFEDEISAVHFVDQRIDLELFAALTDDGRADKGWRRDVSRDNERFKANRDSYFVRSAYLRSFKLLGRSQRDSKYVQCEVLRVDAPAVVGPALFSYFDAEAEWVDYLVARGEESPGDAGDATP